MSINTDIWELLILRKKVKPSHIYDVIEMGNICFMLERRSFRVSQSSEVFDNTADSRYLDFGHLE